MEESLFSPPTQSVFLFYTYCTTVQIVLVFTPYTNLHVPFHVKYVNITVQIGLNGASILLVEYCNMSGWKKSLYAFARLNSVLRILQTLFLENY